MKTFSRTKPIILALFKVLFTILFFYVIAIKVNIADAMATPIENKYFLCIALLIALLTVFLQAGRWLLLLKFLRIPRHKKHDIKLVWAGHFLNNLLPTSAVGDVLRCYSLRMRGVERKLWISSLLIEKFFAMVTALSLGFAVIAIGNLLDTPPILKIIVSIAMLIGVLAPAILMLIYKTGGWLLNYQMFEIFRTLARIISAAISNRIGIATIGASLVINLTICLIFYCVSMALGLNISLMHCLFVVPVFMVLSGLPISYGGWGVRELTGIHMLQYYGVSPQLALSTTFLFGLTIFLSSLPGAIVLRSFRGVLKGIKSI